MAPGPGAEEAPKRLIPRRDLAQLVTPNPQLATLHCQAVWCIHNSMEQAYLTVIILTHIGFAAIFVLLHRQRRLSFLNYFATTWAIQAVRGVLLLEIVRGSDPAKHWFATQDLLSLTASWLLLHGSATFMGKRFSPRWPILYFGVTFPLILALRYALSASWIATPALKPGMLCLLVTSAVGASTGLWALVWFFSLWRRTRFSGALVTAVSFSPHVLTAAIIPVQVHFSYFPPYMHLFWFLQALGLSVGIIMLVLSEQSVERDKAEAALRHSEAQFRQLYGEAPIGYHEVDAEGRVTGLRTTVQDITERKALEQQLQESQKMEAIGRLAGGVAHDFNNLLTAISGYSELVLKRLDPASPTYQDVDQIYRAASRASSLTRQLLAFSRRQVLQARLLDLNAIVSEMSGLLRRLIGEDIALATALEPGLGKVKADRGQIEQVILNLIVNARDAMPNGGKVTVETRNYDPSDSPPGKHFDLQPGSYVVLSVSDTGTGMDSRVQAQLFEPFFTTKEPGKGTGLGLSTVYGIVRQSGGHIAFNSSPGQGTKFDVYLLRVGEAVDVEPPIAAEPHPMRGNETILLVEDEDAVRQFIRVVLQRQGYTVMEARNGAEAIEISTRHSGPLDLMVTDIVMPEMGGLELARRLATSRPEMPVLYLSGYPNDSQSGVLSDGAFLRKPFSFDELAGKVRDLLKSSRRSSQAKSSGSER